MGQTQSKDELLYQQVNYGNIEGIKALHNAGASLEWIDKEGRTPLILACMKPDYIHVVKTLIELGANLNAYRPGSHAGTPLHHASKRGLEQTVRLLVSHGACATVVNDDCQTPRDLARVKGHTNVVRSIEAQVSLFSGWLRELHGPGFLEALTRQWATKKVWAVVMPCDARNQHKLELAIYMGLEIAHPRTVIQLWKAKVVEPEFADTDPVLYITDKTKTKFKFLSASEGDKEQLRWLYNVCSEQQVHATNPADLSTGSASLADMELAVALSASIQSAIQERPSESPNISVSQEADGWGSFVDRQSGCSHAPSQAKSSSSRDSTEPYIASSYNGWDIAQTAEDRMNTPSMQTAISTPSAPPVPGNIHFDGPVDYPVIDSSPVEISFVGERESKSGIVKDGDMESTLCIICLDAPKEGVCVPCGHMVGCMVCLNDIRSKDWGCPVCRAKISQIVKVYTV